MEYKNTSPSYISSLLLFIAILCIYLNEFFEFLVSCIGREIVAITVKANFLVIVFTF